MSPRRRVEAVLTGQAVDRRPVAPVLSLYGARLTGCPLERYYADPEAFARGQAAVRDTFHPDLLFAPFAYASLGAAFGGEARYFADQPPNLKRFALRSIEEWDRLAIPDPDTHPSIVYLRQAVRLLAAAHGAEVPVAVPLVAPIDLPSLILGIDGWLEALLFDPARARQAIEALTPFFVRLVEGLFANGADLMVFPCAFASPQVVTRELLQAVTLPCLASVMSRLNGPVALHHGGAPILAHLDLLAGVSAAGFVVGPEDDLREARRLLGPRRALMSGPMAPRLPGLAAGQVERECLEVLADRRGDPAFLLCSTGADIPWHTPPENIGAIRAAAEAAGPPMP